MAASLLVALIYFGAWAILAIRVAGDTSASLLRISTPSMEDEPGMETFEAIRTVLAVRQFRDTPIPEESVRRIVEAGRLTASSQNGQPWHFIVVQNKDTLRQLGAIARTGTYIP